MRAALAEFNDEIGRINKVADWLSSPPALVADMRLATVAIRCGSVVLLSGYFESFLKDCMQAFIENINLFGPALAKLPAKMRATHYESGAKFLVKAVKEARRSSDMSACEDLSSRLASFNSEDGYMLVWEAFADTESNPGPTVVAGLLSSVGVTDGWQKLNIAAGPGLGDLKLFLESFIQMRNECAHSGNLANPPAAGDLLQYGLSLSGLAEAVVDLLDDRLVELTGL